MNVPLLPTLRVALPLSWRTTVPESPETAPPTEIVGTGGVVQAIAMLVTLADPTVPDPLETVHCCPLGLVATVAL